MVNSRGDHRQRAYNTEERAVIDVHKATYLQATSPAERKQIAKEILADLFNHWSQKGILLEDVDISIRTKVFLIGIVMHTHYSVVPKALVAWIQNNWRSHRISQKKVFRFKMKISEVLWKTRQDEVFAEIATLLGIQSATASTPGWFNQRMPALGNVLARMTTAEREELEKECQRLELEGNKEEDKRKSVPIQCRSDPDLIKHLRLAETSSGRKFDRSAQQNWLEMGLLSITFNVRTTPSGQLAIEV